MILDRRPYWIIGGAVGLVILIGFIFLTPRITPEMRVQEQLSILSREPWTPVRIDQVQFIGEANQPDQVVLRGARVADGSPVVVHFVSKSPYTSPTAMRRLTERALEGRVADVLMLPRSLAQPPYRDQFQPQASHAGVAIFAGFPDRPVTAIHEGANGPAEPATQSAAGTTDG